MKEQLKVTSPEEYAEKAKQASAAESAGFLHKLKKTGAVVRLRHVDMEALALVGSLPMSLVAAATAKDEEKEEAPKGKGKVKPKIKPDPTPEEIEAGNNNLIFMRQMVVENCLEPQIRYQEGVGVFFVHSLSDDNMQADYRFRVDKDDFMEMFTVITGQEGADGLNSFRNRKTRRASTAKSRSKTLRSEALSPVERVIAET